MTDYQINKRLAEIIGLGVGWPLEDGSVKIKYGSFVWNPLINGQQLMSLIKIYEVRVQPRYTDNWGSEPNQLIGWKAKIASNTLYCYSQRASTPEKAVALAIIAAHEDA